MRVFVLCIVAGATAAAAALLDGRFMAPLAAVIVAGLVYAGWFVGHEQGWTQGCIETTRLRDLLADKAAP